jgi:pimeloyl-ACP methyl ester carboxylesterase/DNA-binding CsgD family transcriptional regulator
MRLIANQTRESMNHRIRYVSSADHINLAWTQIGDGAALVKTASWLSHLKYDRESPVWSHWIDFFENHFHFVRYDERGSGMSDWKVGSAALTQRVDDLERVVGAAEIEQPFALLGMCQGVATAITYAVRYPERVSHLILYGGSALDGRKRGTFSDRSFHKSMMDVVRQGWGRDNPTFRQLFTSRYVPQATQAQIDWFNELCRRATSAENVSALLEALDNVDVVDYLPLIETPTLVLHCVHDQVVPFSQGKLIAAHIPNASFVQIDSQNHILQKHEAGWQQFQQAILEFTGKQTCLPQLQTFQTSEVLTTRERTTLALLCDGRSNAQIASQLGISEKTARNHISNLYRKLGVQSRAQAIVMAYRRMQSR